MCEGFRRQDPPAVPQLAVPITVAKACCDAGLASDDPKVQATGDLVLIAFYFLLRVGEYTRPRFVMRNGTKVRATRTKQFSYSNVGFYKDDRIIPRRSSLLDLLGCTSVTLKITNQKNGRMGGTIHQKATGDVHCPVRALARRIHHINTHTTDDSTADPLLCAFFANDDWDSIVSADIIRMVRAAVKLLHLHKNGIDPDLVGAHSLRAGGAMALRLHGFDDTTIMKMGRWTSLTFTQYIHNQIAHLAEDMSHKMSMPLPFLNIASIEGHPR
jgi:hypothetical protein